MAANDPLEPVIGVEKNLSRPRNAAEKCSKRGLKSGGNKLT
jgi:hypothetical protein